MTNGFLFACKDTNFLIFATVSLKILNIILSGLINGGFF